MKNFYIHFSYPWFLLLLVLAAALTLIPYFRLSKRYRRTRNRITSIVLHLCVMVLAIVTFAGIEFRYQIPNDKNEIIFLVDVSDTEERAQDQREEFIQLALRDSQYDGFNVGIVTFGFDQQYAVPLTNEVDKVYERYQNAPLPDTSATNIQDALEYTRTLFNYPETSKIVLITDGLETDKQMISVARAIAAQGTKIDVAHIGAEYANSDIQLMGVEYPATHVNQNEECVLTLSLYSSVSTEAAIELYDNGELAENGAVSVKLTAGMQVVPFYHTFKTEGLHEVQFKVTKTTADSMEENSTYSSYINIEVFNNILIIEGESDTSAALIEMLNKENDIPYEFTVKQVEDETLPFEVDALRAYDQIILNNVSNNDFPKGFVDNLNEYVSVYGGSMFTVGGDVAYDRKAMYGTLYQEMLPVQAIDYTPPVALMIIVDTSGSMGGDDNYGFKLLDWAKAGAFACIDLLTERDYIGIMTLSDVESTVLDLTPQTQRNRIASAINTLGDANGGTVLTSAVDRAGKALRTMNVAKRHIIVITDGGVADAPDDYEGVIKGYYNQNGTTLSVIGVGMQSSGPIYEQMKQATEWGGGKLYVTAEPSQLINKIGEDLTAPAIKQVNYETFKPIAGNVSSPLWKGVEFGEGEERTRIQTTLNGFYGVKLRPDAEMVMYGECNVPIYAQWAYGEGMVGSFMCDLQASEWSAEFMASQPGRKFIRNVVNNLMPGESIRPSMISYTLKEDNYTNQLSVYASLKKGEYIKGELIEYVDGQEVVCSLNEVTKGTPEELRQRACYTTMALSAANEYSRCEFVVRKGGTYKIRLSLCDANGNVIKNISGEDIVTEMYKSFAYSKEYDLLTSKEETPVEDKLESLTERGNGVMIEDLHDTTPIFDGFVTAIDRKYDPRVLFMILVSILFLTDIAVRKFKFKWPHEIIRDYKEKKKAKK